MGEQRGEGKMISGKLFFGRSLTCIACTAVGIGMAGPAWAQAADADPVDARGNQIGGIEEIIVTAQRREQKLQEVPIAISAITAKGVEARGITNTESLSLAVPGLVITRASNGAAPRIRGVGSYVVTQGDENIVAIYIDGVYQIASNTSLFELNNIDRIEVLKGPQGTLFGRNATGGVIHIITKQPSHDMAIDAHVGYSNYDTIQGDLYMTGGLSDTLSVDFAAYGLRQGNGWGKNIATGEDVNRHSEFDIRSKLRWDSGEGTAFTFSYNHNELFNHGGMALRLNPGSVGLDGTEFPGFYNINANVEPYFHTKKDAFSFTASYDADWATFVSITAYTQVRSAVKFDQDTVPTSLLQADLIQKDRSFSQEVQIQSPSSSSVSWIAGVYYLAGRSGYYPLNLNGAFVGTGADIFANQGTKSLAGFGQVTVPLLDSTNLTIGGRYTSDKRDVSGRTDTAAGPGSTLTADKRFNKFTYRLALDHHFSPDAMIYASASRGFKSGLFNTVAPAQEPVQPEVLDAYEMGIKTEWLDRAVQLNASAFYYKYKNMQVGKVVDGSIVTMNAARAENKGFEVEINAAPVNNLTIQAGIAYLDATFSDFPDAPGYQANAGGGMMEHPINAAGNRLQRAPKFTANISAQYNIDTSIGNFVAETSYGYSGKFYWDFANIGAQNSYNILNSSLTFYDSGKSWNIRLWINNITNTKYLSSSSMSTYGYFGVPASPRTYGVRVGFNY